MIRAEVQCLLKIQKKFRPDFKNLKFWMLAPRKIMASTLSFEQKKTLVTLVIQREIDLGPVEQS